MMIEHSKETIRIFNKIRDCFEELSFDEQIAASIILYESFLITEFFKNKKICDSGYSTDLIKELENAMDAIQEIRENLLKKRNSDE